MISNYLTHKILDHVLGLTVYTGPANVYIALFTTMPNSAGVGGVEVVGGSYARPTVTNNTTNWPNAASRIKSNGTAILFAQAGADWGNIVGAGIYDALTAGNLLIFGQFAVILPVNMNDVVSFTVSQFQASVI